MTKTDLLNYISADAEFHKDYTPDSEKLTPFPFKDIDTGNIKFSVAYILKLQHVADAKKNHTTLLAFDGEEFYFWCGENFTDATTVISSVAANKMITSALSFVKNHVDDAKDAMKNLFHSLDKSSGCHFWARWKSKGEVCSHVKHLLKVIETENMIEKLENSFDTYMGAAKVTSSSISDDTKKLQRYAFKKHILFTGPRGFGKTYAATKYINENIPPEDIFEVGGFEGLESIDLLGQNTPFVREIKKAKKSIKLVANNSFSSEDETVHIQDLVWKNGALTAAFKNASKGKKTVLLIDELFRIPSRELSILIATLTPDNKGFFTLRTGKILGLDEDGCGIEEVVKVKKENLWVIATTNVGSDYDIDDVDLALWDRFMIIHKSANRNIIKDILEDVANDKKFKKSLVSKLMEFYDKLNKFKSTGNIAHSPNTRHLTEAIEFADKENEVSEILDDMKLKWIDRNIDGEPDRTQIKLIDKTIADVWS